MGKKHLKRITAPKTWPIERKRTVFITRPRPGGQPMERCVPLSVLFREMLGIARTRRGVRYILNKQEVLINGARRYREDDTAGLFDIITFPATKSSFRIMINKLNRLYAQPVAGKEATLIPSKVRSKRPLKGGRLQLGFHNGRVLLVTKGEYRVGDTLLLSFDNKVEGHFPIGKGAVVLVLGGKHVGRSGKVADVTDQGILVEADGEQLLTTRKHLFVIGTGKPELKVE